MNFLDQQTLWIFVSGSNEERFLNDIKFGIAVLKSKGITSQNIKLFIDGELNLTLANLRTGSADDIEVFNLSNFAVELAKSSFERAVLCSTGHGDEFGLAAANNSLTPHHLISSIRAIPGLKYGLLIMGQCYSGIFNFVDAREEPSICILGSTGFTESLSLQITLPGQILQQLDFELGNESWTANIFLFHFFSWILEPRDIDGSGRHTVMDAFKYASIRTNQHLQHIKCEITYKTPSLVKEYNDFLNSMTKIYPSKEIFPDELNELFRNHIELTLDSHKGEVDNFIGKLYTQQEPFILNSWLAQEMHFH